MPQGLGWAEETLRARSPVIERAELEGDRLQWSLRFPLYGDADRAGDPCLGCTEHDAGPPPADDLPEELQWLADTFGECFVEIQSSGTAPWGRPLPAFRERMFEGVWEALPEEAESWVVLYEVDGDWLCADLKSGRAHWVGMEWTGHLDQSFPNWKPVLHFVFWRMLDNGWVRPTDLHMLFASHRPDPS